MILSLIYPITISAVVEHCGVHKAISGKLKGVYMYMHIYTYTCQRGVYSWDGGSAVRREQSANEIKRLERVGGNALKTASGEGEVQNRLLMYMYTARRRVYIRLDE